MEKWIICSLLECSVFPAAPTREWNRADLRIFPWRLSVPLSRGNQTPAPQLERQVAICVHNPYQKGVSGYSQTHSMEHVTIPLIFPLIFALSTVSFLINCITKEAFNTSCSTSPFIKLIAARSRQDIRGLLSLVPFYPRP